MLKLERDVASHERMVEVGVQLAQTKQEMATYKLKLTDQKHRVNQLEVRSVSS
jgi:hypothetical protein